METLIERAIVEEARKRIARYSQRQYFAAKDRITFSKRTGKKAKVAPQHLPISWSFHKHFDPRYCINHAGFLSRGIWCSLQNGTYTPVKALRVRIEKATGGYRCIDSFSVPDAAIARIFFHNLRLRNAKIFSDASYAYQADKTPLDAILRLRAALTPETMFVSQYDFSQYFDSIQHDYLRGVLAKEGPFLTTQMERSVLHAVMTHAYEDQDGDQGTRETGIPQGNSLSLFLANAAAHSLDSQLSALNGTFARFADDSVVVNRSYEDSLRCADAYHRFSDRSGVRINEKKSTGIRIFSSAQAEMAHVEAFDFLSYRFTRDGLHVSPKSVQGIKRRCARIIYNHLLLHPRRVKAFSAKRLGTGFRDWDLVTCVNELRSFVYGGVRQSLIDDYLAGNAKIRNLSGAVSYFALVENGAIFRELDGWLIDALWRAYRARVRLLNKIKKGSAKPISKDKILTGGWYRYKALAMETKPPSFFTAWRAARKSWLQHGLGGINPRGLGYEY